MNAHERQALSWVLVEVVISNALDSGSIGDFVRDRGGSERDVAAVERMVSAQADRAMRWKAGAQDRAAADRVEGGTDE